MKDAAHAGIAFVHQELNLFENLDVAANIYIGREPRSGGMLNLIDNAALHGSVKPLLSRLGVDFEPDDLVENLSIAQRQMVEIAKALSMDARIIIMDEPTSSLTLTETEKLLAGHRRPQAAGVSMIYISHRLGEVKQCADRVVVLRDGRQVGELAKAEINHAAMVRLMIGRDLKSLYIPPKVGIRRRRPGGPEPRHVRFPRAGGFPRACGAARSWVLPAWSAPAGLTGPDGLRRAAGARRHASTRWRAYFHEDAARCDRQWAST